MSERPLILITNDDGITANGLRTLVKVASDFGEVLVVAPDKPQSGMGHAITIHDPLRLNASDEHGEVRAFSCSGTPVDCVKLAIYHVLERRPDLVISGINHGSNCSVNVLYSGTMSAAVEGAIEGIPSIGFSLMEHGSQADFSHTPPVLRILIENALNNGMAKGICLNVNIPKASDGPLKGIRICRQGQAHWEDKFDTREDPTGGKYHWLTGAFMSTDKGEDTDMWALDHGYVSVVPTQFDMTAHHAIAAINEWTLK